MTSSQVLVPQTFCSPLSLQASAFRGQETAFSSCGLASRITPSNPPLQPAFRVFSGDSLTTTPAAATFGGNSGANPSNCLQIYAAMRGISA
jgi:hypothetical protein